jgi:endonuclease YncB( thermonuclease family)
MVVTGSKKLYRVGLYGVDAPTPSQPGGADAKRALSDLALGKTVRLKVHGLDDDLRYLVDIYVGDTWANEELLRQGLARQDRESSSQALSKAEAEAKLAKKGLWKAE